MKNDPHNNDEFNGGTYKLDFEDSLYHIKCNNMVVEYKKDGSIIGQIFDLKIIKSYKIWQ